MLGMVQERGMAQDRPEEEHDPLYLTELCGW